MQTVSPATIDYQKDVLPPILQGKATVNGSRAVLWEWNPEKRKYDQADILASATVTERQGNLVIAGQSKLLSEDSGFEGDASLVTVTVKPKPGGCKDCR